MAILGFHFSGVYKEALFSRHKTATILAGEYYFKPGQEVLVYLSDKPNLFDGRVERRIGRARLQKIAIKKVRDLSLAEAKLCGYKNIAEIKQDLHKWYQADDSFTITFVKFHLKLDR